MAEHIPPVLRKHQESFKLSSNEFEMLCALTASSAAGSRSAVLRDLICTAAGALPAAHQPSAKQKRPRQKSPLPTTRLPPHRDVVFLLTQIGNLLNQTSRGLHVARHAGTLIDVALLHFILVVIRIQLEHVQDNYTEQKEKEAKSAPKRSPP
jgi:hypothetical protein